MRQKRAKAYKRVMALYTSAFSFRQPYQVLLGTDFLLEAGKQKEIDMLKIVQRTVQGDIKPSKSSRRSGVGGLAYI
jgi:U3 small nucleolar RNA-associated protein 23